MAGSLSWSLVIATYNRRDSLLRCLDLALQQTRLPVEVIVVDGSADWAVTRDAVLSGVAARHPDVRWEYVEARVRSLTAQRNQGIALARGDVLFLIDDDSFLFPDCAAEVMRVYEADAKKVVAGVGPLLTAAPPGTEQTPADGTPPRVGLRQRIADFFERQLEVENLLLPYDPVYPAHELPAEVRALDVAPTHYLSGMRMTYRREVIQVEKFEELLRRYAAAEDLDASYRASRHGALLNAPRARLYHAQDPSARLTRYTRNLLGLTNMAVLFRLKGHDPKAMFRRFRWRVLRRLCIDVLRDLSRGRLSLPCARADWRGLRLLGTILAREEADLRQWYPTFQDELIERNPA